MFNEKGLKNVFPQSKVIRVLLDYVYVNLRSHIGIIHNNACCIFTGCAGF